ncbi:MAG: hypothetical protein WBG90_10820 [Saonia sp.]
MLDTPTNTLIYKLRYIPICLFLGLVFSCSDEDIATADDMEAVDPQEEPTNDNNDGEEENDNGNGEEGSGNNSSCTDPGDFIFNEKDGYVHIEFEEAKFSGDWELKSNESGFSGDGYMVWTGTQHTGQPGNGFVTYSLKISNPGTYQFLWKSAVTIGDNGTEHNDTWLRFDDADDFYAQKGESIVYPKGTGKTPNPEGATKDGWFKIYRSGNDLGFKWQSRTFDNNAHDIFVRFDQAGTYTMEISARSSGHAIDKFVLFKTPFTQSDAISESNELSVISCNQ